MIKVCEIYKSIQGESSRAGMLCSFVRLSGCNLSCAYCDTSYALDEGEDMSVDEVFRAVGDLGCMLVEITGGEPLLQNETKRLCSLLLEAGYTVLVETNGSLDISALPRGCIRIVDVKCPGSGMEGSFFVGNCEHLDANDECKMVISSRKDFEWALDFVNKYGIPDRCQVVFSPNTDKTDPKDLAEWIIASNAPVRMGMQLHKIIWGGSVRGV